MRRALSVCVILFAGCGDRVAPGWPEGAALSVEPRSPEVSHVSWPAAHDDEGVTAYGVVVDGTPRPRLPGDARALELDGLDPEREHRVQVVAYDAAGNASVALVARAQTADERAPRFAADAALAVELGPPGDSGERPIQLAWPAAEDDVGVVAYAVLVDADPVARTDGRVASLLRALDGAEVFEVRAIDAAGNQSAGLHALAPGAVDGPPESPDDADEPTLAPGDPRRGVRLVSVEHVSGGRDEAQVARALRAGLLSVGGCYRRALESGPNFDGHLTLEIDVRGAGSVRASRVVGAGMGRPELVRCMQGVVARAAFPRGDDAVYRARYAFSLARP